MLLCQQEIDMAGKPRTSREIHHPAQSSLGMLLRDNIDKAKLGDPSGFTECIQANYAD